MFKKKISDENIICENESCIWWRVCKPPHCVQLACIIYERNRVLAISCSFTLQFPKIILWTFTMFSYVMTSIGQPEHGASSLPIFLVLSPDYTNQANLLSCFFPSKSNVSSMLEILFHHLNNSNFFILFKTIVKLMV